MFEINFVHITNVLTYVFLTISLKSGLCHVSIFLLTDFFSKSSVVVLSFRETD